MRARPSTHPRTPKSGLTASSSVSSTRSLTRADSRRPASAKRPLAPRHRYPARPKDRAPQPVYHRAGARSTCAGPSYVAHCTHVARAARCVPCDAACTRVQLALSASARHAFSVHAPHARCACTSLSPFLFLVSIAQSSMYKPALLHYGLFSPAFLAYRITGSSHSSLEIIFRRRLSPSSALSLHFFSSIALRIRPIFLHLFIHPAYPHTT